LRFLKTLKNESENPEVSKHVIVGIADHPTPTSQP